MWENQNTRMPFGSKQLIISAQTFMYFTQELYNYLLTFQSPVTVDILTCGMDQIFTDEITSMSKTLKIVTFNYSMNNAHGSLGSKWVIRKSISNGNINDTVSDITSINLTIVG